jgi:DNA helicase MCM8
VNAVAARGVYVCGTYASSSGLTVTALKEKGTGDFVLEAGALVSFLLCSTFHKFYKLN